MGVETKSTYHTSDGQSFDNYRDAARHEARYELQAWLVDRGLPHSDAREIARAMVVDADLILKTLGSATQNFTVRKDDHR